MNSILLVEDDPMSANLIRSLLQKPGSAEFEVLVVNRAATACQTLGTTTFDLILLDLMLPDSHGADTVNRVRAAAPQTPIVVLSNINVDKVTLQAIEAQAQDYLVKAQVNGLLLHRILRYTIERQRLLTELQAQAQAVKAEVNERQRAEEQLHFSQDELDAAEQELTKQYSALAAATQTADRERLRFQTLARISPVGIFHANAEAQCLYVNQRWTEIAALPADEALGEGWCRAIHPEDRERVVAEFERCGRTRQPFHMEYRYGGTDHRPTTWVLGQSAAELDPSGTLIGFVGTITDITFLKQTEERFRRLNAELEERVTARTAELSARSQELRVTIEALHRAAQLKDDFMASMSHELRTPLTGILNTAEAFSLGVYGAAEPRQLRALQTIFESGQHLLALINDILDLAKIEAGKMEMQVGPVPVEDVCHASLAMIKQTTTLKQLHLSMHIDPDVSVVQADGRRLKQMLVNLLSNAVKFTPEGGQVGLEVAGDAALDLAHFTVWDTGVGIAPENMRQLFQPFVQLNNPLAGQTHGTGLGLSLVLRMAELHGGGVTVESKVAEGSRFTVSIPWHAAQGRPQAQPLPAHPTPEALQFQAARSRAAAGRPVILIADDNTLVLQTLSDFLGALAYQVAVAYDGREAVEVAQKIRPNLILMDIQMPGINGLEAIRRLRAEPEAELAGVPIVALTALTMPGDRELCLAAGANDYLAKPVKLSHLAEVIETLLKQG